MPDKEDDSIVTNIINNNNKNNKDDEEITFKSGAHFALTSQLKTLRLFFKILHELCVTYFQWQIADNKTTIRDEFN